ncbi:DNA-binding transcriptional response regulator [Ovoidimarina sediminis]|uniref:hypothetical protein n=1 Tax=Ovoidimarina sediminis TaxID=3079856 RepID=UPI00290B7A7D|nr:hypothetical protein [Rhodophyticola sp. MJ-SS7]MDU8946126.1 hypothetical protein [Rhodophyticola sp. MJ-SS7]
MKDVLSPLSANLLWIDEDGDICPPEICALEQAGLVIEWKRVWRDHDLREELGRTEAWDVILCTYRDLGRSAEMALSIVSKLSPELPVILLSEAVSLVEEAAANMISIGARDVIPRGNLARLPAVVRREIANRRAVATERSHLQAAIDCMNESIAVFDSGVPPLKWSTNRGSFASSTLSR